MKRFWDKVDKSRDCWEWTASKKGAGYGQLIVGGKNMSAHRLSWKIHNGEIPKDMCVCHKCDNPGCVNPEHLFIGTRKDNTSDMFSKGREHKRHGINSGRHILKDSDVVEIREKYSTGLTTYPRLGEEYGVSPTTIQHAVSGFNWRHV